MTGRDLLPLAATKHFLLLTGCVAFLYGLDLCAMAPSPPEAWPPEPKWLCIGILSLRADKVVE